MQVANGLRNAYPIVQDVVLLLHACHESVFGQWVRPSAVLSVRPFDLLLERLYVRWKPAIESKVFTLLRGKGGSFVERRGSQERGTLRLVLANESIARTSILTSNGHSCGPEVDRGRWLYFPILLRPRACELSLANWLGQCSRFNASGSFVPCLLES